ncbi:MAG TPA: glycoside hydrolase family 3 N-terminal domain-containing protein [Bacteroidota bacterium]|nr:glycoside hydrolase family 3 N-terminal domain-containing protein [Bacteroidota bacterium]
MAEDIEQAEIHVRRQSLIYKDPARSTDDRVRDLLGRMTLDEKVAQMLCIWNRKKDLLLNEEGRPDGALIRKNLPHGIGQIARLSDTNGGLTARESAEFANALQRLIIENTRLGIPVVFHEECLHGLAGREATSYPQPIGLAATFNPDLVEEIFSTVATEVRERGAHQALTPDIDVARDPRWGRVEETFGEDPYLVSRMGIAAVRGFQGDGTFSDKKHILATLKHFAAHGQPESGTNCGPVNVSERVLRDTYLYPFKEVLAHAGAASVMASYNEIDGVPSHANRWLLQEVLRGEWGFEGYVVSDYYAITELHQKSDSLSHAVARDKKEAALLAIMAGVSIELPDPDCYPFIPQLIRSGALDESTLDELLAPLLKYKFQMGLFEDPYVDPDAVRAGDRARDSRALALRAAHETITLLKNEGSLLPLDRKNLRSIAVIGPNADRVLLGGYSGTPVYSSTLLQGIRDKVQKSTTVLYSEGCKITIGGSWNEDAVTPSNPEDDRKAIADAVDTARMADVVVLALGGNEQTSREAWLKTHLGDRASLDLVGRQDELVRAVLAAGKPTIVVLFHGRPNSINVIQQHVPAILDCWYLGQESGNAVADVLFGDHNPGGKLPISVPRSAGHLPAYYSAKPSARRGYLFDDVSPLFPFGFGLSYTQFRLTNLRLDDATIGVDGRTTVRVDVANTGDRAGDEVVQLYVRDLISSVTRPMKELKGFWKVHLAPGESTTVALSVGPDQLAFTNIDKRYCVEPGEFHLMVGTSSRDEDQQTILLHVVP